MTGLEKEAEKFFCKYKYRVFDEGQCKDESLYAWTSLAIKESYIAGAKAREKRIEELIALINAERKRQEKCDDVHLRKISELEEENELLKAQIEKMKCCGNCAKQGSVCVAEEYKGILCGKQKDKWELKGAGYDKRRKARIRNDCRR